MKTLDCCIEIDLRHFDEPRKTSFIATRFMEYSDRLNGPKHPVGISMRPGVGHPNCSSLRGDLRYYLNLPVGVVKHFSSSEPDYGAICVPSENPTSSLKTYYLT